MSTHDETPPQGPDHSVGQGQTPPERGAEDLAALIGQAERLDGMVERLRAERAPLDKASADTPALAELLPTAALLRSAAPDGGEPGAAFVEELRARLTGTGEARPAAPSGARRVADVSRRGFLRRGAVAAAAAAGLAAGAAIGRQVEIGAGSTGAAWPKRLVTSGQWVPVALAGALPVGGVQRFATDALVGYLRRTADGYDALSAACTHMGCLVAWNAGARSFDCPCHGGRFREDGTAHPASTVAYRPLPWIETKVENGQVWVLAPRDNSPAPDGSSDTSGRYGNG